MTAPTHLRLLRWGVPVVAAAAVAAVASGVFAAQADPSLPAKTAGQLLVDLQGAQRRRAVRHGGAGLRPRPPAAAAGRQRQLRR